jgi:hypothetical protein
LTEGGAAEKSIGGGCKQPGKLEQGYQGNFLHLIMFYLQRNVKIMRKNRGCCYRASGSIYFKLLLDKLSAIQQQWDDVAVVMSDKRLKCMGKTELGGTLQTYLSL